MRAEERTTKADCRDRQLVSLKTLAAEWQCSRSTVRRFLRDAGVRAYFFGDERNSMVRYSRAEVDRFLENRRERQEVRMRK